MCVEKDESRWLYVCIAFSNRTCFSLSVIHVPYLLHATSRSESFKHDDDDR